MFIDYFKKNRVKIEVLTDGEFYFFFTIGWFVAKARRTNIEQNNGNTWNVTYHWEVERTEQISQETIEKYIRKAEPSTDYLHKAHVFRYINEDNKPQHELPFSINIKLERIK